MSDQEDFVPMFSGLVHQSSQVLDVASGKGRHALYFARLGCSVLALEGNAGAVHECRHVALTEGLCLETVEADVEKMSLLPASFDVIVNTLFLYRPLFSQYISALRPNGLLFFRTFTTDNLDVLKHPSPNRRYLLDPGELYRSFQELEVIHYQEGVMDDRALATLIARK